MSAPLNRCGGAYSSTMNTDGRGVPRLGMLYFDSFETNRNACTTLM
jgi:hypothetical protein